MCSTSSKTSQWYLRTLIYKTKRKNNIHCYFSKYVSNNSYTRGGKNSYIFITIHCKMHFFMGDHFV